MAGGRGNKKRFSNCIDPSRQEILDFPALQSQSGRNVLIPNNFCEYIYQIGCAVSLHSITNSGLIAGGQNSSHRDPQELDLTKPRLALYKQMWKRHLDTVYWVDIQFAQKD